MVCRQYESAVKDLKEALSLVPGHREIQRLLARVEDELKASSCLADNQTTIVPEPAVDSSARTKTIPDIVPGAECTDSYSLDSIEQNSTMSND